MGLRVQPDTKKMKRRMDADPDLLPQARDAAVQTAWEAAQLIRRHAGRIPEADVHEKGVHDLVTQVDEQAQSLIVEALGRSFPGFEVLAEEGAAATADRADADGYRWIIDPIDGTTNFTRGVPPYAVSIALQHRHDVVVGVVLDVAHGDLFTAVRGGGAYHNGRPVGVSRRSALDRSLLATGFPYRAYGHIDLYLDVFKQFTTAARGIRRPGAASVDLAYVACGRFDGFFETGLSPWDVAAGLLLVEEAGGRVTDYRDTPCPLFARQVLATNGHLHDAMLAILHPMRNV
jgi:myo-inositol-1(or 4)-monophosphatase